MTVPSTARTGLVPAGDAVPLLGGPLGALLLAGRDDTAGGPAFVVHDLAPRALGSPVHTHTREDEWSYVLSGAVGVEIGDTVSVARAGDLVLKPRGVPHAFWNAGDVPARLLEIISPAGFENYFRDMAPLLTDVEGNHERIMQVAQRYDLDIDFSTIPILAERHHLRLG